MILPDVITPRLGRERELYAFKSRHTPGINFYLNQGYLIDTFACTAVASGTNHVAARHEPRT